MKKYGVQIGSLLLCAALLCTGCGGTGNTDDSTTGTTTTTVPTTTTTLTPTTTQKAQAAGQLLVNSPDGKPVDAELLSRLKSICSPHKHELSFYYKDLVSGYSIEFRADEIYQTASVIKAPYVKYLLEVANVDLNKKLKMTKKQGGSSHIDAQPIGTEFTVKELMEYAIRYSDNTAYYMLNEEFGFSGFNAYADMLGIRSNNANKLTLVFPKPRFGYLSARDAGLYFEDIAKYIEQGSENAKMLKSWLTTTTVDGMLADALGATYEVAHKYGEQGSQAYHDAAIVYAPQPYVLTILSTLEPYADASDKVFSNVAALIDAIQTQLHA
ncbi:MAG: serine hydrolase [Clostridia bacterium]|nr:serine hydrolase [Clostridia bacterium]